MCGVGPDRVSDGAWRVRRWVATLFLHHEQDHDDDDVTVRTRRRAAARGARLRHDVHRVLRVGARARVRGTTRLARVRRATAVTRRCVKRPDDRDTSATSLFRQVGLGREGARRATERRGRGRLAAHRDVRVARRGRGVAAALARGAYILHTITLHYTTLHSIPFHSISHRTVPHCAAAVHLAALARRASLAARRVVCFWSPHARAARVPSLLVVSRTTGGSHPRSSERAAFLKRTMECVCVAVCRA